MIFRFLLCLCIIELYGVQARTDQEIKAWFFHEGLECNNEHPLSPKEMLMLKANKIPETDTAKCFVACIFKKTGMLDSKGMYDAAASVAMTEKDFANDPKKQENSKKLLESCTTVNDASVTDGEKGCERSVLLHKCFVETAPQGSDFLCRFEESDKFLKLGINIQICGPAERAHEVIIVDFSLGIQLPK